MNISFTIPVQIEWLIPEANQPIPDLNEEQLELIKKYIPKNGRIYEDGFLSDKPGKINLLDCTIEKINSGTLKITFIVKCEETAEALTPDDIIYAIMPACYTDQDDDRFMYDDQIYYHYTQNFKILKILETPNILP